MTATQPIPASFGGPDVVMTDEQGRVGNKASHDHSAWMETKVHQVSDKAWTVIGNGLSNQTFVEGPEGLIVIDTGECREEMKAGLELVREFTSAPIAAVIYTHFHYCAGTEALADEVDLDTLPIWGHEDIAFNRSRSMTEIGTAYARGLSFQFGVFLPTEGPDGVINVGLGRYYRNPAHAPYTDGYLAPRNLISGDADVTRASVAGLDVEFLLAPSDADDSVTIWFPSLKLSINNLMWPVLFNVFPIRGEEYRDPRVLLKGLDDLAALGSEYLIGCHGPPMVGQDAIREQVELYRDSIQFMWDQTVRGINRGMTAGELIEFVQLPAEFNENPITSQFYGLAEHHVRQIHSGLRGWFDDDEARLFPVPTAERARRLIQGFGGATAVEQQIDAAVAADDLRWALEMATWLVQADAQEGTVVAAAGTDADRQRLASVLRAIGQRTTSANLRNWTLTRARELEGQLDMSRFRNHRLGYGAYRDAPVDTSVGVLKVLIDPGRAEGVTGSFAVRFDDGSQAGLKVRRGVAVPFDGSDADVTLVTNAEAWARVISGRTPLSEAQTAGEVTIEGDDGQVETILRCFDVAGFHG